MSKSVGKSKQKSEKLGLAERENLLLGIMEGKPVEAAGRWPDYGKLVVVRTGDHSGFLVEVGEHNIVRRVDQSTLRASISRWTGALDIPFQMERKHIVSLANRWLDQSKGVPFESIKHIAWRDYTGLAWAKIPYILSEIEKAPCPSWDSILCRMTNAEKFKAWVWSLFEEKSYQQQYCWLKGVGADGKGSMLKALGKILGPGYASLMVPSFNDTHWSMGLIGKRLCAFTEMEQPNFVTTARFKAMTGDDGLACNPKFGAPITIFPKAKYLILSQKSPLISSDRADMRRVVFCEFKTSGPRAIDPQFQEKMDAEVGAFLYKCYRAYRSQCPNHESISVDQESLEVLTFDEDSYDGIFDRHFSFDPTAYILARKYEEIVTAIFPSKAEKSEFREYIQRKKGIEIKVVREGKMTNKVYKNLTLKGVLTPTL